MFILDIKYKAPISIIEKFIDEHRKFLDEYYAQQKFILSGPKIPRTGGIILADIECKSELMKIIKEDPFYINNLADYFMIEFNPNKSLLKR